MTAFARFVMRDNGLAVHINAQLVTQVRQTIEGDPAIYISGRDTPMIVEGTLEATVRKLEAAASGLKLVEAFDEPIIETAPEPIAAEVAAAKFEPEPTPAPTVNAPTKAKALVKAKAQAKAKKPAKVEAAPEAPVKVQAPKEPETLYPAASWFRGNR